jgi:hypothetical protein
MRVENKVSDHGDRLARIETKLDLLVERRSMRWLTVWPSLVAAVVSGSVMMALHRFAG